MANVGFCGLKPLLFRLKPCGLEAMKGSTMLKNKLKPFSKGVKDGSSGESIECSFVGAQQLILMMEIQKRILAFRDIMDLAPCNNSASFREMVVKTLEDLQRLYPGIILRNEVSGIKGKSIDKVLPYFCKALKSLGESWMTNNNRMNKVNYELPSCTDKGNMKELGEIALVTLDCLIKLASEKFDIMEEDEQKKPSPGSRSSEKFIMRSSRSLSESSFSASSSPLTPTSVLPEMIKNCGRAGGDSPRNHCTSPLLWSLRVQAVGKLNPIDVKRLTFRMSPPPMDDKMQEETTRDMEMDDKSSDSEDDEPEDLVFDFDTAQESDNTIHDDDHKPTCTPSLLQQLKVLKPPPPPPPPSPQAPVPTLSIQQPNVAALALLSRSPPPPPPPPAISQYEETVKREQLPPPPPPPPSSQGLGSAGAAPPPPPAPPLPRGLGLTAAAPPPPPPIPLMDRSVLTPPPLPPVPLKAGSVLVPPPPMPPGNRAAPPLPMPLGSRAAPPPPMPCGNKAGPPPPMPCGNKAGPPPPMPCGNKGGPPPPPLLGAGKPLRPKATTKLKRSTHLCTLYRKLKGKLEGSNLNGKSSGGRKSAVGGGGSTGGKQGMADALAEMTKRSSYFQQIEEDVQKYTKEITVLGPSITNFKTKDMTELINFHKDVESVLEKLTDESQVLSRFEGFPIKKLEAIRMAAAIFNKLNSILMELLNWNVVPPLAQVLDKVERYFNKIKTDIDALERTKDEESKKFKSHNIEFDFHILVKIKEAMVDVSSNCMELALEVSREVAATKSEENAKILWRAFQFAFKVYTFAGGHDDRADRLTRELAEAIESSPPSL